MTGRQCVGRRQQGHVSWSFCGFYSAQARRVVSDSGLTLALPLFHQCLLSTALVHWGTLHFQEIVMMLGVVSPCISLLCLCCFANMAAI